MPKQEMILTVAMALTLSASSASGGQNSPPPVAQKRSEEAVPLRPEDFPLKAEVKERGTSLSASSVEALEATGCKDLKGSMAIACREGVAATIRAIQRVVAKINERVYVLDGPRLPLGVYPARSIDDGKGFEFLTKGEKGNYQAIRYTIFQEAKPWKPPTRQKH